MPDMDVRQGQRRQDVDFATGRGRYEKSIRDTYKLLSPEQQTYSIGISAPIRVRHTLVRKTLIYIEFTYTQF